MNEGRQHDEPSLADLLITIIERLHIMSKELDALTAQVAANTTVIQSAEALIAGLAAQITAAGTDPVALQALTDSWTAADSGLAAAVAANTPAAPAA